MGLLDYYRQFDDIGESEFNKTLRERRAREKALALEIVPTLDLSGTEWPELPNAEVVSASVYQARGRLNGYPDPEATQVRRTLAERHNIRGAQIAVGNGAAELLRSAIYLLAAGGGEVVVPRPTRIPLHGACDARGRTRRRAGHDRRGPDMMRSHVGQRPHAGPGALQPERPDRRLHPPGPARGPAGTAADHVHVLLDESYVQFQDVEPEDACMSLVEAFPSLIALRSFSRSTDCPGSGRVTRSAHPSARRSRGHSLRR